MLCCRDFYLPMEISIRYLPGMPTCADVHKRAITSGLGGLRGFWGWVAVTDTVTELYEHLHYTVLSLPNQSPFPPSQLPNRTLLRDVLCSLPIDAKTHRQGRACQPVGWSNEAADGAGDVIALLQN